MTSELILFKCVLKGGGCILKQVWGNFYIILLHTWTLFIISIHFNNFNYLQFQLLFIISIEQIFQELLHDLETEW